MFEPKETSNYKFTQNKKCEYFPCHKMENMENFNCLFCYCPLYMLGEECGGNFRYTENGVKDCSQCVVTHTKDSGFDHVMEKMTTVISKVQKSYLKNQTKK